MEVKTKLKLIKGLFVLLVILVFVIVEAFFLEVNRITISRNTFASKDLPEEFENLSVLFFTDLHYGTTITAENIDFLIEKINNLQPDLVLFGGDLIDRNTNYQFTQEDIDALSTSLSNIYAKFGKYAVLGNHDLGNSTITLQVSDVLNLGGFTILTNEAVRFHNNTTSSIKIVGIDSQLLGNPNVSLAFSDVRASDFTILLCHTPDIMSEVNTSLVDLAFAGHSHGHQVYIPFISSNILPPYATKYSRGKYEIDSALLHVSNGIGTTRVKARLFSNPELVFYHLTIPKEQ